MLALITAPFWRRPISEPTRSHGPSRTRAIAGLFAATVLLPLAFMLLGLWEVQRGTDDWTAFDAERSRLTGVVADLEARAPRDGRMDFRMQFRRNGQSYVGPLALDQARAARDEAAIMTTLMDWRRVFPPVAVVAGFLAAMLSLLVLLAGAVLGWAGQTSRETLVRGFSLVRRLLPPVLAAQILLAAAGFVAIVIFEAGMLAQPELGGGDIKLLLLAAVAVMTTLFAAGTTVLGLRRALAAFEPDPLPIHGRIVSVAEAPGLWRLIEGLAARLGALKPEVVVVGLTGGFFVSAGPAVLEPGGERLRGRILYLPLPYLALMRSDETAAIIAHELAHYAGGDTAYSQRFLPIYAGVSRSLDAIAEGQQGSLGLLGPSLRLGVFVMERFHLAVRHWSRAREFAADAAGAGVTSADASARALLRSGSVQPPIVEALDAAAAAPESAPADLVEAALDRTMARGLDDPASHLETEQAHPTDTHPTTRERVSALGRAIDPDLLAAAGAAPPPQALGQLAAYFAEPTGLCRAATDDFLGTVRARDEALTLHLEATAAEVGSEEQVLRENSRPGAIVFVTAGGLFSVMALAMLLLGFPGLSASESSIVAAVALVIGVLFAGFGANRLRRGERVTLVLRRDGLQVPGLDLMIPWDDVADLDITANQTGMVTRLLLPPEAAFPQRVPGGRGLKLDPKRRIITIALGLPRKMKPQDFADLISRYRQAARARRVLAERIAGASPECVPSIHIA